MDTALIAILLTAAFEAAILIAVYLDMLRGDEDLETELKDKIR